MKTLLTILFFINTVVLIVLSFLLFQWLDEGVSRKAIILLLLAYGSCIFLLGFLLMRYMNLPMEQSYKSMLNEGAGNGWQ